MSLSLQVLIEEKGRGARRGDLSYGYAASVLIDVDKLFHCLGSPTCGMGHM